MLEPEEFNELLVPWRSLVDFVNGEENRYAVLQHKNGQYTVLDLPSGSRGQSWYITSSAALSRTIPVVDTTDRVWKFIREATETEYEEQSF